MPNRIFHKEDVYLIPFSLLWGGFAIFWEASVLGLGGHQAKSGTTWTFGVIWGIPFVAIGQYIIWGRFLYAAWKKRRTFYALTNRRVIAVQDGSNRRMASAFIDTLPALIKEGGSGAAATLRFAQPDPLSRQRGWSVWDSMAIGASPVFTDIEGAEDLYRVIAELRQKTASAGRSN
jgi:hypothetical protein